LCIISFSFISSVVLTDKLYYGPLNSVITLQVLAKDQNHFGGHSMKIKTALMTYLIISLSFFQFAMARKGIYDEEAREEARVAKQEAKAATAEGRSVLPHPKRIAEGVKEATVDSTTGLVSETVEATAEEAPVKGTLEGARLGTGKVLDSTLKGAVKVATLGYGELKNYEVEEPESGSGEPTKIKIRIPGT
jgi:hypothetical protein